MKRQPWVQHVFNLGLNPGWAQNVLTRISDVAARCEYHCRDLPNELMDRKPAPEKWSIKEHLGHLIDLEELHIHRLKQFKGKVGELKGADMSNAKTEATDYNARSLGEILTSLNEEREKLISEFSSLPEDCLVHEAFHPRLKIAMKPVDLLFFVGEHDDHHLTTILELKKKWLEA